MKNSYLMHIDEQTAQGIPLEDISFLSSFKANLLEDVLDDIAIVEVTLSNPGGNQVAALIKEVPDQTIWAIVQNWPTRFEAKRSRDLGFTAETSFDEIVKAHIEDELGGKLPAL